jgi:hypothetical protein
MAEDHPMTDAEKVSIASPRLTIDAHQALGSAGSSYPSVHAARSGFGFWGDTNPFARAEACGDFIPSTQAADCLDVSAPDRPTGLPGQAGPRNTQQEAKASGALLAMGGADRRGCLWRSTGRKCRYDRADASDPLQSSPNGACAGSRSSKLSSSPKAWSLARHWRCRIGF